uniref:Uncharacterized protein n=1 Tax=Romanomermis culicivorax TaxID=13658 RepID=A0A915KQH1_ROMCU
MVYYLLVLSLIL